MSAPSRAVTLLLAGLVLAACGSGAAVAPGPAAPTATSDLAPSAVTTAPVATSPPAGPLPATAPPATAPPAAPAPAAPVAPVAAAAPVVVLDPGHNGGNARDLRAINRPVPDGRGGTKPCNTTGTQTDAGYTEHAFNWDLALRVRTLLQARGITVVLTRENDTGVGPCVDVRGAAGERAHADAVVSLHADGSAPANHGFHVAYSEPPLNPAQAGPAHVLAAALRDHLRAGGFAVSDYIGHDGLSARSDLAGLSLSTRPTALVECANMRNAAEAAQLSSPDGRARYAAAVAAGIEAFLHR